MGRRQSSHGSLGIKIAARMERGPRRDGKKRGGMGRQTTGEAGLSPPKAYACGPPARQVPRLIGTGHAETHHRDGTCQGRGIKTNLKLGKYRLATVTRLLPASGEDSGGPNRPGVVRYVLCIRF
ncbi:hypothetical protein ASPFODRAFT_78633 [Aspergillus luchuensis CBS 106.47]|uniref:Uncharacterized protein n=1 Tax=Aspergillus luchuensis (strain CBS 106.47) TaxID=1137211 RepID=A0A1M3TQG2_ASPLC|nr:hypothetical protein ASPFODRAFT_78633 [Aspergillus luchuensis CBS 106.47]